MCGIWAYMLKSSLTELETGIAVTLCDFSTGGNNFSTFFCNIKLHRNLLKIGFPDPSLCYGHSEWKAFYLFLFRNIETSEGLGP